MDAYDLNTGFGWLVVDRFLTRFSSMKSGEMVGDGDESEVMQTMRMDGWLEGGENNAEDTFCTIFRFYSALLQEVHICYS